MKKFIGKNSNEVVDQIKTKIDRNTDSGEGNKKKGNLFIIYLTYIYVYISYVNSILFILSHIGRATFVIPFLLSIGLQFYSIHDNCVLGDNRSVHIEQKEISIGYSTWTTT